MKTSFYIVLALTIIAGAWSCTPRHGCTETTADNYDVNAEDDDGTCIPSRDKLIGEFDYTSFWTDVVTGMDTFAFGTIQITEANTADNAYNTNFDGALFLQGSVTQDNLLFENHIFGTASYTGIGTWLRNDSVDLVLNVTYNDVFLPIPQPFTFYLTKTP